MSELYEKIEQGMKDALRAKDSIRLNGLRYIKSEVVKLIQAPNRKDRTITDADVVAVLQAEAKGTQDKLDMVKAGGFEPEAKDLAYLDLVRSLTPAQKSDEELEAIIVGILGETEDRTPKVRGFVNAKLKEQHGGTFESAKANAILGKLLAAGK